MGNYSVGVSSYQDLAGETQYVSSKSLADSFNSAAMDFDAQRTDGARLTANEAKRTRARQQYFWDYRFVLGITVAPPFTSRHDEIKHGDAVDVGLTLKNGKNRALTPAEFVNAHLILAKFGWEWTGKEFGEEWHHEGGRRQSKASYKNPRIAGSPIKTNQPVQGADMADAVAIITDGSRVMGHLDGAYLTFGSIAERDAFQKLNPVIRTVHPNTFNKLIVIATKEQK